MNVSVHGATTQLEGDLETIRNITSRLGESDLRRVRA